MGERVALVLATSTGGIGRHVQALAAGLSTAGHRVVVFGPAATEDLFGFTARGARFVPVEIASGPRPSADARAVRVLRRGVRGADLVHAHGMRAGLIARAAVAGRRTPLIVTWHNRVLASGLRAAAYRPLERLVATGATVSLGASPDLVERVRGLGGRDVRFGPVAAPPLGPPERAREQVRAEIGAGDRPLILAVGRLHPQKGYEVLLAAAARWRDRRPRPLLAIAGSGPLEASLQAQAERLETPVRFLGHRRDVADLLAASDLVVLPSRWEARSLVAQEALRAGRPLVATAVGGLPDLLGAGARLVPVGDAEALAVAVAGLLDDPDEAARLVARGHVQAAGWPDEQDTLTLVEDLYAQVLGRGR